MDHFFPNKHDVPRKIAQYKTIQYKKHQMFTCISLKSCTKISFEIIACSKLLVYIYCRQKCKILKILAGEII